MSLSYQHIYHAGNFADIHKHALLSRLVTYLHTQTRHMTLIDTHGGRGLYDMHDPMAQRHKEFIHGFDKLKPYLAGKRDVSEDLSPFLKFFTKALPKGSRGRHYPGSSALMAASLRKDDRLFSCELHPGEFKELIGALNTDERVRIFYKDGMAWLSEQFRGHRDRAVFVHCDPSFEIKDDYSTIPETLARFAARYWQSCVMLWYPVLADRSEVGIELAKPFIDQGLNIWQHECNPDSQKEVRGMRGSGVLVAGKVNVPHLALQNCADAIENLLNN